LRRVASTLYFCLLALVGLEISLRIVEAVSQYSGSAGMQLAAFGPTGLNASAPAQPSIQMTRPEETLRTAGLRTAFRVAALGSERALGGAGSGNYLSQLEGRVPGLEVYRFNPAAADSPRQTRRLQQEIAACQPDLILAFVSVADDIRREHKAGGLFD